jgi:hypothetical protein
MLDEIQREVAVHLLANAIRKRRIAAARHAAVSESPALLGNRRRTPEDEYLRGMLDLLTSLYGRGFADELYQAAQALERTTTTA